MKSLLCFAMQSNSYLRGCRSAFRSQLEDIDIMIDKEYDLAVIGGGPGGYTAAIAASSKYGLKTVLIEKENIGGTCLGHGCIPTKTYLAAADEVQTIKNGNRLGVLVNEADVRIDMAKLHAYKNEVVSKLQDGIMQALSHAKVDYVSGTASIRSNRAIDVKTESGSELIKTAKILIATGSEPCRLPIKGVDLPHVYNSNEMLEMTELMSPLVIIGGGVIGLEFASMYSAFGAQVVVLEAMDRILSNMDRDFAVNLKQILSKRGVEFHTGAEVSEIVKAGFRATTSLEVKFNDKKTGNETTVPAQAVLVAVGRRTATEELFDKNCLPSIPSMDKGRVKVNDRYETDVPGIYAIGDVTGGIQLAHMASAEGLNAVAVIAGKEELPVRTDVVPACVFTDPEIASVGLSADEAKKAGIAVKSIKYVTGANGKSVLTGQERGFIRILTDPESGKILGAQMMCARASDMIGEFSSAIVNGLTVDQISMAIRPHPTFNEMIWEMTR